MHNIEPDRVKRGRVKWFSKTKKYGFVIPEGETTTGNDDVFIHVRGFCPPNPEKDDWLDEEEFPQDDEEIIYVAEQTEKGMRAQLWTFAEAYDHSFHPSHSDQTPRRRIRSMR